MQFAKRSNKKEPFRTGVDYWPDARSPSLIGHQWVCPLDIPYLALVNRANIQDTCGMLLSYTVGLSSSSYTRVLRPFSPAPSMGVISFVTLLLVL